MPKAVQAELLDISRSSLYYQPIPVKPEILFVMNRIDDVDTAHPFYGSRIIAKEIGIDRKQEQRLMREMGIEAQYPNHIVGTDITYIKMTKGFCYLTAFMDWFSRFVLSWKLSITLETTFCFEAAEEVVKDFGAVSNGKKYTYKDTRLFWRQGQELETI